MTKAAEETKKVRGPAKPVPFVLIDNRNPGDADTRMVNATCESGVFDYAFTVRKATTEEIMRLAVAGVLLEEAGG